jgi:hypothetical protein
MCDAYKESVYMWGVCTSATEVNVMRKSKKDTTRGGRTCETQCMQCNRDCNSYADKRHTSVNPTGSKFLDPVSPMNMGSTFSPPTKPLANSLRDVVARLVEDAGAKAAAEANKDAKTIDFMVC